MKTSEITSMIVARAEPKPIRLASPTTFWVTRAEISSSPLRPLFTTQTRSKARSDSITVITSDDDVDGPQHREHDPEEGLRLAGTVDRRGLAQRRVDALQSRPGTAA